MLFFINKINSQSKLLNVKENSIQMATSKSK